MVVFLLKAISSFCHRGNSTVGFVLHQDCLQNTELALLIAAEVIRNKGMSEKLVQTRAGWGDMVTT